MKRYRCSLCGFSSDYKFVIERHFQRKKRKECKRARVLVENEKRESSPQTTAMEPCACHPYQSQERTQCPICISDFVPGELVCSLPCGHLFHKLCITMLLKRLQECLPCKVGEP